MRFTLPSDRGFYVPKGAVAVRDRSSDAVAYLHVRDRQSLPGKKDPAAVVFFGKQGRPVLNGFFTSEASREAEVRRLFEVRRQSLAFKAEQRAARKAKGRGLVVGDVVTASWGYEQTNTQFYAITKLIGSTMVELREVATQAADGHGFEGYGDRGYCKPVPDRFIGPVLRKVAKDGCVSIDSVRHARKWDGRPLYWSSYA